MMLATDNNPRMANLAPQKQKHTTPEGLAMGRRISLAREEMARTDENFRNLRWFARQIPTSSGTISRYENGERQPHSVDDRIIGKIAELLKVRVQWLRYGDGPKEIGGEPEIVSDLQHYLSKHIASRELVVEVLKNPARWSPLVVTQADTMRNANDYEDKTPLQRLQDAERLFQQARFGDAEGVDRLLQREYGPKIPREKKKKPKRNA